jgi:predicted enzyme related to lactoylglutathione lyase
MRTKGINRVAIVVKDFDGAVTLYSELLNTTFYPLTIAEGSGVRVALSYDAGIEIASPLAGSKQPSALGLSQYVKDHGEGLYAVVFSIDDIEQARDKAEKMGIRVLRKVEVGQNEVKQSFHGRYNTFIEYFLNPEDIYGASVVLGQF